MCDQKLHHGPVYQAIAHRARGRHLETASNGLVRGLDGRLQIIDPLQDLICFLVVGLAHLRQRNLPCRPVQKTDAELVFQFPNILGNQRLGPPHLARGRRKAFAVNDLNKTAHARYGVHILSRDPSIGLVRSQ